MRLGFLGKFAGMIVSSLVLLAGCDDVGHSGATNTKAEQVAIEQCVRVAVSDEFCRCVIARMSETLSGEEYDAWTRIVLANEQATSRSQIARLAEMSSVELNKFNEKFGRVSDQAAVTCGSEVMR